MLINIFLIIYIKFSATQYFLNGVYQSHLKVFYSFNIKWMPKSPQLPTKLLQNNSLVLEYIITSISQILSRKLELLYSLVPNWYADKYNSHQYNKQLKSQL
jgi:hypothetical protein